MTAPVCALTGANGYVGSCIRRTFQAYGWRVIPLVRKAQPDAIAWSFENSTSIAGELRRRGVQAIVHAAWDMTEVKPAAYHGKNFGGSKRLFEQAASAGIETIVFISTISAFENAVSLYGRTKLRTEEEAAAFKGLSIRPGLVWGAKSGSVFGAIERTVKNAGIIPLIGSGRYPQYLVHEDDLGQSVFRAVAEKWTGVSSRPVTVANPNKWYFRDLVVSCATRAGKQVKLISVPWRVLYAGLKMAELAGLGLSFRSDSVLSLVNQNPDPDFNGLREFGIQVRPYVGTAAKVTAV